MRKILIAAGLALAAWSFAPASADVATGLAEDDSGPAVQERALDASKEPVATCEWRNMADATKGILIVSWLRAAKMCEMAKTELGKDLPLGFFRYLVKASGMLEVKGAGPAEQNAYQLVSIVDARGLTDSDRMKATVDLAFRAYVGSNGRVTPRDLNVVIRKLGLARTLSDDGLLGVAAMISVEKKNNGE